MSSEATVECPDGKVRTWHRNLSSSLAGYVYLRSRRVYGFRYLDEDRFVFAPRSDEWHRRIGW